MAVKKQFKYNSVRVIMFGFLGAILIGTLLLLLPFSTAPGQVTRPIDALFTAATSICVTGLVTVDTFSHWSLFGKVVILILIQLGGFGVITLYSMIILILGRSFTLRTQMLIQDYYNLDSLSGLIRFLKRVIIATLAVEGIGALLYAFRFIPQFGWPSGIFFSIFHSVSAFCNAGIDILGPDSLVPYQTDVYINVVTMTLIVLGGLGYIVWFDFYDKFKAFSSIVGKRNVRLKLNEMSRLVIKLTSILIVSGAVLVFLLEHDNPDTIGNLPLGNQILASIFQSVTFRTAGFATIPQGNLRPATCMIGLLYMFIGGSPVGTAGGVKTVTFYILFANVLSFIRGQEETVCYGKRIRSSIINKATAVITVSLAITFTCLTALLITDDLPIISASYEIFSATATVGLSRGITSSLSDAGKLIVIFAMYAGRIGPISMALFFTPHSYSKRKVRHAPGHFTVG